MEIPITITLSFICFLASLTVYFIPNTKFYLKTFPIFLLIRMIWDGIGTYMGRHNIGNSLIYNTYMVWDFSYYLFILRLIIQNRQVKEVIFHLLWIFPVFSFFNMFFVQGLDNFNTLTYSTGCLLIVAACGFYFYELFHLAYAVNLLREPAFWICSGLLFFYCCSFPLLGLINYLYSASSIIIKDLGIILTLINILLNFLFVTGFLCRFRFRFRFNKSIL